MANANLVGLGKNFLAEVLKHVPEDKRAAVEEGLLASEAALEVVGNGTKRQDEFSRAMDAAREIETKGKALYETNKQWFEANKPLVELGKQAQEAGWSPLDPDPNGDGKKAPVQHANVIDRDTLATELNTREAGAAVFMAKLNDLSMDHFIRFGERLDTTALLNDPTVQKLGLEAGYRQVYAEKIQAKVTAEETARIGKLVEEGVAARLKTQRSAPPYPVAPGAGSPLDALTPVDGKPSVDFSPEAAAADYASLVAAKSGAGAGA